MCPGRVGAAGESPVGVGAIGSGPPLTRSRTVGTLVSVPGQAEVPARGPPGVRQSPLPAIGRAARAPCGVSTFHACGPTTIGRALVTGAPSSLG